MDEQRIWKDWEPATMDKDGLMHQSPPEGFEFDCEKCDAGIDHGPHVMKLRRKGERPHL